MKHRNMSGVGSSVEAGNRRKALSAIVVGSGGAVWAKPVLESVVLPAHAQTSESGVGDSGGSSGGGETPPCSGGTLMVSGGGRATSVIDYQTANVGATFSDPTQALGAPDYDGDITDNPEQFVSLGRTPGYLILGFDSGVVVSNSGDALFDVGVIEVGNVVESVLVRLRPLSGSDTETVLDAQGVLSKDSDGFFEIGMLSGAVSQIDIDAATLNAFSTGALLFDQIKIVSNLANPSDINATYGPDIDAVEIFTFYSGC